MPVEAVRCKRRPSIVGTLQGHLGSDGERLTMTDVHVETPEAQLTLSGSLGGTASADVTVNGPVANPTVVVIASGRNLCYSTHHG